MTEAKKKGIGKAKAGLVVCAVLVVILAVSNVWSYTNLQNQVNQLHTDKTNLESQLDSLNTEYWDLYANYTHENWWHHYYENQTLALKAPKLSVLSVYSGDVRPWSGTPYLHVYGEIWNVGSDTAYNCRLHVILYQGSVVAKDTYVNLGTIFGENKKSVDANIYYNGDALTNRSITPEWTTTP